MSGAVVGFGDLPFAVSFCDVEISTRFAVETGKNC
jgi:hypothetical protein